MPRISGLRTDTVTYQPDLQSSGDMEPAVKTINTAAEPGAADYSWTGGVAAPADARLVVTRICARLQITIDSWAGGGTTLNYRIKRGGVSIGTGTLEVAGGVGAKYVAHDVTTGALTGDALYEVFLWVNAGSCDISVATLWMGVGSRATSVGEQVLRLDHSGFCTLGFQFVVQGSGTGEGRWEISNNINIYANRVTGVSGVNAGIVNVGLLTVDSAYFCINGTVATDLNYLHNMLVNLQVEA